MLAVFLLKTLNGQFELLVFALFRGIDEEEIIENIFKLEQCGEHVFFFKNIDLKVASSSHFRFIGANLREAITPFATLGSLL
jgi:hypothetical protein